MFDRKLLEIVVCPKCKQDLLLVDGGRGLVCNSCNIKYPVRDDIPVLKVDEITDLKNNELKLKENKSSLPKIKFRVISGPEKGLKFYLERRTCRAIGRGEANSDRTLMLNVDVALSIDDGTKSLILQYISKQFKKKEEGSYNQLSGEKIGLFRRVSDVVLTDHSLSRLHAMIFASEDKIGLLDLVSKNGTYINGKEVESTLLKKGDVLEMGETKITFEE